MLLIADKTHEEGSLNVVRFPKLLLVSLHNQPVAKLCLSQSIHGSMVSHWDLYNLAPESWWYKQKRPCHSVHFARLQFDLCTISRSTLKWSKKLITSWINGGFCLTHISHGSKQPIQIIKESFADAPKLRPIDTIDPWLREPSS